MDKKNEDYKHNHDNQICKRKIIIEKNDADYKDNS